MDASTERVPGEGGPPLGSGAERACPSTNAASSSSSLGRRRRTSLHSAYYSTAYMRNLRP